MNTRTPILPGERAATDAQPAGRWTLCLFLLTLAACGSEADESAARPNGPNVLFVVWDTTRADHLSLYGHSRPTTPFLERWSADALVFEDCLSTASSTVPSHGAMFTGLLPSEHGANNQHLFLSGSHQTLAEIFRDAGYGTYCYSANPHISEEENFSQGFQTVEHPWDPAHFEAALDLVRAKVPATDQSSELPAYLRSQTPRTWDLKAAGELAGESLLNWLDSRQGDRPYFAFLNYMEAHRPFVTPRRFREQLMTPDEVERSYQIDRSWQRMWSYTFGLAEYSEEELRIMSLTYDACILELDHLFKELLEGLAADGHLENTIVVLVGDHGEHLGEHHLLDHQYSLYQGLIHVPLLISYPGHIAPGRSQSPVANFDLFPTLLNLAGLDPPAGLRSLAVDLTTPDEGRLRLSESPSDFDFAIRTLQETHPGWDSAPWRRRLTALQDSQTKLIWASDGKHELYELASDPAEEHDLAATRQRELKRWLSRLADLVGRLEPFDYDPRENPELSWQQSERLQALGYFDGDGESE